MLLSTRCLSIIRQLLVNEHPLTIRSIASRLGVSPRSIRSDLDAIDDWLILNCQPKISRKPNVGVQLMSDKDTTWKLINKTSLSGDLLRDPAQRVMVIVGMFLFQRVNLRRADLADLLQVSSSTIANDIRKVKEWMNIVGIKLTMNPHTGLYVKDTEKNIRQALFILLLKILGVESEKQNLIKNRFANVSHIMENYYLLEFKKSLDNWREDILHCIDILCEADNLNMSDSGFCNMFIFILILITRINVGATVQLSREETQFVQSRSNDIDCEYFFDFLAQKTGIPLNINERVYFTAQWMSQTKFNRKLQNVCAEDIKISMEIIESVQKALDIRFTVDENTKIMMAAHINALFYRTLMNIRNEDTDELVTDIKSEYNEIYNVVQDTMIKILDRSLGHSNICDIEVAYITMYIMVSIYKSLIGREKKIKVIIVCGSSIATSKVLESRLAMVFSNIKVLKTLPYNEFLTGSHQAMNCDLIISTVPISYTFCPNIMVNPLLKPVDITKLTKYFMLQTTQYIDLHQYIGATINITSKVLNLSPQEEILLLMNLTKNLATEVKKMSYENAPTLLDLLSPGVIHTQVQVNNCSDAIQYSTSILLKDEAFKQKYVNKIINLNRELGGYMAIDKGIAMPHLLVQELDSPAVSIITLQKPVYFGHKYNDPVDIIILLLSNNKTVHIRVIEDIIDLLNDKEAVAELRRAQSAHEILHTIGHHHE